VGLGQGKRPAETAEIELFTGVFFGSFFCVLCLLGRNRQDIVLQIDFEIFFFQTRCCHFKAEAVFMLYDIDCGGVGVSNRCKEIIVFAKYVAKQ